MVSRHAVPRVQDVNDQHLDRLRVAATLTARVPLLGGTLRCGNEVVAVVEATQTHLVDRAGLRRVTPVGFRSAVAGALAARRTGRHVTVRSAREGPVQVDLVPDAATQVDGAGVVRRIEGPRDRWWLAAPMSVAASQPVIESVFADVDLPSTDVKLRGDGALDSTVVEASTACGDHVTAAALHDTLVRLSAELAAGRFEALSAPLLAST